ncbi:MAG: hypothetical protein KDD60_05815 [Bdellovibrionales bacterium]|nr:hypothetical protein [Bdellovibrionales bacterium]
METCSSRPSLGQPLKRALRHIAAAWLLTAILGLFPCFAGATPATLIVVPVGPQNENSITLIYPENQKKLGKNVHQWLLREFTDLAALLGKPNGMKLQVQLTESERFYRETGMPRWTNAIYYNSQIIIPIKNSLVGEDSQLVRAVRHELVHAITDFLTGGRCPGWLDEGLAQYLEGDEHPALRSALERWVKESGPISFTALQSGFTKLNRKMVPAAYAQSFYSVNQLFHRGSESSFQKFFSALGAGGEESDVFENAFGVSIETFTSEIYAQLNSWKIGKNAHGKMLATYRLVRTNGDSASTPAEKASLRQTKVKYTEAR